MKHGRLILGVLTVLALVACGPDPYDPESSAGAPPQDSEPDGVEPGETDHDELAEMYEALAPDPPTLDEVAGPGLLALLDLTDGRVEVVSSLAGIGSMAPADFYDGGRVLRFDRHPDLDEIIADYRVVLAERNPQRKAWARVSLPEIDPTVVRLTVADVVGLGFIDHPMLNLTGPECLAELAELRTTFLATPPPLPEWRHTGDGREEWEYPVDTIPPDLACVTETFSGEPDELARLVFERNLDRGTVRVLIELSADDGELHPFIELRVIGSEPAQPRPAMPDAALFDPAVVFLLAANTCGELPWAYSNFMAGDSYTSPDDSSYAEPGPFTSRYVCADDVPQRN